MLHDCIAGESAQGRGPGSQGPALPLGWAAVARGRRRPPPALPHPHPLSTELLSERLNAYSLAKGENLKTLYLAKIAVTIVLQLF